MALDPVFLARLQFGFTITFHIIFPAFTIGGGGGRGARDVRDQGNRPIGRPCPWNGIFR